MTLSIDHFAHSCTFDFAFDDEPFIHDWNTCTVTVQPVPSHPFILKLSAQGYGDLAYAIYPVFPHSYLLIDINDGSSCFFNPCQSAEYIADDIDVIIEDEELSSLISYSIVSFGILSIGGATQ